MLYDIAGRFKWHLNFCFELFWKVLDPEKADSFRSRELNMYCMYWQQIYWLLTTTTGYSILFSFIIYQSHITHDGKHLNKTQIFKYFWCSRKQRAKSKAAANKRYKSPIIIILLQSGREHTLARITEYLTFSRKMCIDMMIWRISKAIIFTIAI